MKQTVANAAGRGGFLGVADITVEGTGSVIQPSGHTGQTQVDNARISTTYQLGHGCWKSFTAVGPRLVRMIGFKGRVRPQTGLTPFGLPDEDLLAGTVMDEDFRLVHLALGMRMASDIAPF
jgi:hypothetical protein